MLAAVGRRQRGKVAPCGSRKASVVNAAHVEWVTKNNAKAVELYKKAAGISSNADKIAEHILNDKEVMLERGVNETELQLLIDLIS